MAAEDTTATRDADSWARHTGPLSVTDAPEGALNLNVDGRLLTGPMQGFGKLWQKTYRVALVGASATPEEVIAAWKANYGEFWPDGNNFYAPLSGIQPGEVGLINADMPGGMKLSTGVMVLYADDVSFTYMTPLGHPFAGWITFSADEVDGTTHAQVQVLMRATDPASELGLALGGHRTEDRMWAQTLTNLATFFDVVDPQVDTDLVCVDRKRQWARAGNLRHDAALHTAAHLLTAPVRAIGMSWRGLLTAAAVTNAVVHAAYMLMASVVILPAIVLSVLPLLGLAVAARWERTGAGIVGASGLVMLLAMAPFALTDLAQVGSPVTFLYALLSLLTGATMVIAGVALVRRRTGSPRRLALAGAVIITLGVIATTAAAVTTTSDELDSGEVEVVAEEFVWVPVDLTAASDATLNVDNRDPFHHTFAIEELGIEVDLPANTARDVPLDGASPGVYTFVCTVVGHETMTGTIEVTE